MAERVDTLRDAVVTASDRGYPVWVGGHVGAVRRVASEHADGWNSWDSEVEHFRDRATEVRALAEREPFVVSWGGLVVIAPDDDRAEAKARRLGVAPDVIVGGPARVARELAAYADAGADWIVVGPIDSSDPDNASLLGEAVAPLLRER
jgi:alkanesulfonate monooxygenase SsuD/methylene tetrahydromethanopterin reductase-like flavin-dependent oxidoreductase (luciferase family)